MSLRTYIRKQLKLIASESRISSVAIGEIEALLINALEKVVMNAIVIKMNCRKRTVEARDIEASVKVSLPSEISKYGRSRALKAYTRYNATTVHPKGTSRSTKAGLDIPVSIVENMIRSMVADNEEKGLRVSDESGVYAGGVLQYLTIELLEVSLHEADKENKKTITDTIVVNAVKKDIDLGELFHCRYFEPSRMDFVVRN